MDCLYEVLGVDRDATLEQIKKAHRIKCTENHPDLGGDSDVFKAVQYAYEVLSDPDRRSHYDETGFDSGEPDSPMTASERIVSECIRNLIHHPGGDFIQMIRKSLDKTLEGIMAKARPIEKQIDVIESRIEALQLKDNKSESSGEGFHLVNELFHVLLEEQQRNLAKWNRGIANIKEAVSIVENLKCNTGASNATPLMYRHFREAGDMNWP